ncbi:MAG TPA: hypothetical protein VHY80_09095 [Stellaceae bacterium]|nr:hypothetical protein [Stellaceae bacterium]
MTGASGARPRIMSAAFSAIMIKGVLRAAGRAGTDDDVIIRAVLGHFSSRDSDFNRKQPGFRQFSPGTPHQQH